MHQPVDIPNENSAARVVASLTKETVLSSFRMTTGDQYFVFAVKTASSEYVIRMTDEKHKHNCQSGIYWQEKLIPLGIPLAKFINADVDCQYSPFPSVLMHRL